MEEEREFLELLREQEEALAAMQADEAALEDEAEQQEVDDEPTGDAEVENDDAEYDDGEYDDEEYDEEYDDGEYDDEEYDDSAVDGIDDEQAKRYREQARFVNSITDPYVQLGRPVEGPTPEEQAMTGRMKDLHSEEEIASFRAALREFKPSVRQLTIAQHVFVNSPISFVKSVTDLAELPAEIGFEVCFCGRSNVGKSSLMNALFGHNRRLVKTSSTPVRCCKCSCCACGGALIGSGIPSEHAAGPHQDAELLPRRH